VISEQLPRAIAEADTGLVVIDDCINALKQNGVMHNHARMWLAGISCNMAGTYWREPARWLHYHLLDGDLASNTLSWQWIAGTFSHKQYLANQSNIDKYSKTQQPGSWLDVPYEQFDDFAIQTACTAFALAT
jgi:deoxyribodipyrimidine photo-lyase